MSRIQNSARIFFVVAGVLAASASWAEQRSWSVSRSAGEVWVVGDGAQPASLSTDVRPGDVIRTGRNGRALLVRGEESILISPNSSIAMPGTGSDETTTTIVQQAGTILLEVEKRNVKHFEVQTPSLAAVVKGTQFRVSIGTRGTSVNVVRGQVEVSHYKTGQIAQISPGQTATSYAEGKIGLLLSGSGKLSPIEHGKPRSSPVEMIQIPRNGLMAPRQAGNNTSVRSIAQTKGVVVLGGQQAKASSFTLVRSGVRLSAPIGEVRLNFSRVTQGLARNTGPVVSSRGQTVSTSETIWSSNGPASNTTVSSPSGVPSPISTTTAAATPTASPSPTVATSGVPGGPGGGPGGSGGSEKGNRGNHGGHEKEGKGGHGKGGGKH